MMRDAGLEWFALAVGALVGALFGVSGFDDGGKPVELAANQRVKNLAWVFGGAAVMMGLDWNALAPGAVSGPQKTMMVEWYFAGVTASASLTLALVAATIARTVRARARQDPTFRGRAGELILDYVTYGYARCRQRLAEWDADAVTRADPAEAMGRMGATLASLMAAVALDRTEPNDARREELIDLALEAIEKTVQLFGAGTPDWRLRTNYMAMVPGDRLGGMEPRFTDDRARYAGYLAFRRYRDGVGGRMCLPVGRDPQATDMLPGAPASAAGRTATWINTRSVAFGEGVAGRLRGEMRRYFDAAPYASVMSVPLVWERGVVGVANVESSVVDVVGRGPDTVRHLGNALAPYCMALGELVHRAEERRAAHAG